MCAPTVRVEVENAAWPEAFTGTVPRVVAPSMNVTLPEVAGALATVSVTVAMKVTLAPAVEGEPDVCDRARRRRVGSRGRVHGWLSWRYWAGSYRTRLRSWH